MKIYTAYNAKTRGGAYVLWERLVVELNVSGDHDLWYAMPEAIPGAERSHHAVGKPDGSAMVFLLKLFFVSLFQGRVEPGSIALSQGNLYSLALLPLTFKGARLVTIVHGDYLREYDFNGHPPILKKVIRRFLGMAYRRSTLFLPVSHDLQERTRVDFNLPSDRFLVVPNSVPSISSPSRAGVVGSFDQKEGEPLLLFVGALQQIKRVDLLLEALALLLPADACPQVRIVGEGPLRSELEALRYALGLGDRVQFLGALPDVRERMGEADLLVLCSDYEGCPTVLMEALANRVLVLCTNVGGMPEIVELDELLVPPGEPEALAERIRSLLAAQGAEKEALLARWLARAQTFQVPWERGVTLALESLADRDLS